MAYNHNGNSYKHQVKAIRIRKITFVVVFIFLAVVLFIAFDWIKGQFSTSNTVVSRENTSIVQSANVSVYRTEYFQFQAPEEWVFVSSLSTDKKFVYVKNNDSLVSQRLIVYVDRPVTSMEADFKATNVLPIEVTSLGNFTPVGGVSTHCNDSWPEGLKRNPERITHDGVSFVCHPSSAQYNVIIGQAEGSEIIPATLDDGREITLTIIFSDLTAYPGPGDLFNIISSFNTL